jgi:hypothetical protein
MQDSKLVQIFSKISGHEQARLRKFVASPYHNTREDLSQLLEFLIQTSRRKKPNYDKISAWQACYGQEKPYNDNTLRCLMRFLLVLIEEFWIIEALKNHTFQKNDFLFHKYKSLALTSESIYLQTLSRAWLTQQPQRDRIYLQQQYQLLEADYGLSYALNRNTDRSFQPFAHALEASFIAEKLRQTCFLWAHQSVYKIEYDFGLLPQVVAHIEQNTNTWLAYPAISLYYYYYKSISSEKNLGQSYFESYLVLLLGLKTEFSHEELRNLYRMAINYTIKQANLSLDLGAIRQMFNLYQSGLEQGFLLENGQISRFAYKNVIGLVLRLGEWEWASQFLETYTPLLPKPYQESYSNFANGKFCAAQKKYTQALIHLQLVEQKDIFLNLDAKVSQLKIYYELGELLLLDNFLQTFRIFVNRRRTRLSYHYQNYRNIIRFARKLLQFPNMSKKKKLLLAQKIQAAEPLTEKNWFLKFLQV